MKNIQHSTIKIFNSGEYLNAYLGNFLLLEIVLLIQKHKSYEIMQLIKDKNKIRWNEKGKLITDPTLDFFNKNLMFSF